MRIKIGPITMGFIYEAYIVCPQNYEEYFARTAKTLEEKMSVKTGVFVYDRDPLDNKVKKALSTCTNVLFVLTDDIIADAARDESSPFLKAYVHVAKTNRHSVSLAAFDNCNHHYDLDFPECMGDFAWLHRKSYETSFTTPDMMAAMLFEEFRYGYSNKAKARLEKLNESGVSNYTAIYYALRRNMIISVIALILQIVFMFYVKGYGFNSSFTLPYIVAAASMAISIGRVLYLHVRALDVSSLFANFKNRTMIRLSILIGILTFTTLMTVNIMFADHTDFNTYILFVSWAILTVLSALVKSSIIYAQRYKCYLRYKEITNKVNLIFLVIDLMLFIAFYIITAICL